jgi:translation initiation factor 2 subunit 1
MGFYENDMPDVNDNVVCKVKRVVDDNIYVELLEYDEIEGMILSHNVSRRKSLNLKDTLFVCTVICVDKEKKFIDLSKKVVTDDEAEIALDKYHKAKNMYSIFCRVSEITNYPLEKLRSLFMSNFSSDDSKQCLPDDVKSVFDAEYLKRFPKEIITFKKYINITNFTSAGVVAIKSALDRSKDFGVEVKLVSSPLYMLSSTDEDKLNNCILAIEDSIVKSGGNMQIKTD